MNADARALLLVPAGGVARAVARVVASLAVVVIAALVFAPWQQSAPGAGRVIAFAPIERQQPLDAPVDGRVLRWYVQEGSRVRAGDAVVDLADNDPDIVRRTQMERATVVQRMDAASARVAAAAERMQALKASRGSAIAGQEARARMAADRVRAAEQALIAAEQAQKAADANEARQHSLAADGLVSRRAVELAELESVRARTDADRARAALAAARSEESAVRADVSRVANDGSAAVQDAAAARAIAEAEIASATAELARIDVRLSRQATQEVKAPRDGVVLRIMAKQGGDFVKAGDTLAVLVPDAGERAVELWIAGNDVNLVRAGRAVRLQFEGWPAVQFSGWPSAAVGTFGGVVAFVDAADDGKGRFRVVVVPDATSSWPPPEHLRQGTRANGWVLLERVSLGYELWRQFNGFPPDWAREKEKTK